MYLNQYLSTPGEEALLRRPQDLTHGPQRSKDLRYSKLRTFFPLAQDTAPERTVACGSRVALHAALLIW